jgi:hypothetical protein
MDFATTLAALDELKGEEVLVAIDRFEGSFKPQLVSQGRLGAVQMVPEITDTGAAIDHRGQDLPPDQKTWERGVAFFPIGEADEDAFANGPAGFYLNPAEFDHGPLEGSAVRLFLGDLTICLETAA